MSSGAAFHVAVGCQKLDEGLIVTLFPDRGEKYLSTPLYLPEPCEHTVSSRVNESGESRDGDFVKELWLDS